MAQPMTFKDEQGNTYKISYSEELQLKNLKATQEQNFWLKKNFYMMLILGCLGIMLLALVFGALYWADSHQVISRLLNGR